MSASETVCFLKFLPIMIKHLVPERDPVWKFLLKVEHLSDLLNLTSYTERDITALRKAITDHHKTFRRLFPKEKLKPKFHFLLHYPDVISSMGSPKKNNCYMYESKHKDLKRVARTSISRKFLPMTIAKKIAIQYSAYKYNRSNYKITEFSKQRPINKLSLRKITQDHQTLLQQSGMNPCHTTYYKQITFREHEYKVGHVIAENKSTFYRITAIINVQNEHFLAVKKLTTVYNRKTSFYLILGSGVRKIIKFSQIRSFPLNSHNVRGTSYVKSKFF